MLYASASKHRLPATFFSLILVSVAVFAFTGGAQAQSRSVSSVRPVARLIGAVGSPSTPRAIGSRTLAHAVVMPHRAVAATSNVAFAADDERRIFDLINSERQAQGLALLKFDAELSRVAREHSGEMATSNYLNHTNRAGQDAGARARENGIDWRSLAENIARNQGFEDPAAFAVERWMKSAKHRANISNGSYTHTGLGVARAADGTFYFTQLFMSR